MGVIIDRKDLYTAVWSTPQKKLAQEYGVSDQAISKACHRSNIPRPGRGYWAKLAAGKTAHKLPLPLRGPGESDTIHIGRYEGQRRTEDDIIAEIPSPPVYDETLEDMHARIVKMVGKVTYPRTNAKTHPIIQTFLTQDEARAREYVKNPYDWYKPHYDTPVEKRRLRLLNAIFLAAHSHGYKPSMSTSQYEHANRTASIMVGSQSVEFELKPIKPKGRHNNESSRKQQPLELTIQGANKESATKQYWCDTDDARLELCLTDILIELIMTGERNLRQRAQHIYEWNINYRNDLIEKRKQQAIERERQELEAIENEKKARIDKLLSDANELRQADNIRNYVQRVLEQHGEEDPDVASWAEWAAISS
jgi:hypothetical protein